MVEKRHTVGSVPAPGGGARVGDHRVVRFVERVGLRGSVALVGVVLGLAGLARPAAAAPANPDGAGSSTTLLTSDGLPGRRVVVDTPMQMYRAEAAAAPRTLYLERCRGGCPIHKGTNDAQASTSSIPTITESMIGEFTNSMDIAGAVADAEWAQVVTCMKEVYSPYDVVVTDVKPTSGTYDEVIIAGLSSDIGLAKNVLGVAPLANNCSAIDDVISFTFANQHGGTDRVLDICWTAAQESAHTFGLDHEYSFLTGYAANDHSACNDPMTYRQDCGGEKFFRNADANCGEDGPRPCKCTASQNSHAKLLGVFGAGAPITGSPTLALVSPASGAVLPAPGASVVVQAGAKRGVAHVDLYFNGHKWTEYPGARFESEGQPDPSAYAIPVDPRLPPSIVDIQAIAYDDLGAKAASPVVTATYGGPCATADTCAKGQKCEAGKCFWDPPVGELGEGCAYPEFCKSGMCTGTQGEEVCTQGCVPDAADGCPDGFACVASGRSDGVCVFGPATAGCCSTGGGGGRWWAHIALAAAVFGLVLRRRRR